MGVDFGEAAKRSSVEDEYRRERWSGIVEKVDCDEALQSGKHGGKSNSSGRGRKDRSRDRRKDADRDKLREKERRDHKEREREREEEDGERGRGRDKERVKEKNRDKDREKEKEKEKDRAKDNKEREKYRDRERGYGRHRGGKETCEREKERNRDREKEKLAEEDKDRASERDNNSRKQEEEASKDGGSRDGRRQVIIIGEEEDRIEAETRSNAFQSALPASAFGDDDDDEELRKSLQRARRIGLQKQGKSGPMVINSSKANESASENPNASSGDQPDSKAKVVFTEMEEFVWGLQQLDEAKKPETEDVFMEEDVGTDVQDAQENKEELGPPIHEPAVGKGLATALQLLRDRGTLKETPATKEIRIERTDEYGRTLTQKEYFRRILSEKFHGKVPGKKKQEKRMREYEMELKIKHMKNGDTVERMREAQAKMKTPYLVLSGNVKHGQSSGFATVERDFAGGFTPMLGVGVGVGDKKKG